MKYSIHKNLMDEIDTEEKAYWLGFFYADAYNNEKLGRLVVELQERDKEHLIKCANFFGNPRQPFIQYKNKGKYIAYRLELNSKHLTKLLAEKGCHQAKSLNITFPEWLNEKLIRHFVRGYFDGDGCLYIHQDQLHLSVVSTQEMLDKFAILLKNINVNSQIKHPKKYINNTYLLDSGGSRQVIRFCEWIYENATIYLDRKYQIYDQYIRTHTPRFSK